MGADRERPLQRQAAYCDLPKWETDLARLQAATAFSRCLAEVALLRHQCLTEKEAARVLRIPLVTFRGRIRRIYTEFQIDGILQLVLCVERALAGSRNNSDPSVQGPVPDRAPPLGLAAGHNQRTKHSGSGQE